MSLKTLRNEIKWFDKSGTSPQELNQIRTNIFNMNETGVITDSDKNELLKDLYQIATKKNIFFIKVMERKTKDLPKTPEEALELENERAAEEESYEESYSYEEDEEEEDDE